MNCLSYNRATTATLRLLLIAASNVDDHGSIIMFHNKKMNHVKCKKPFFMCITTAICTPTLLCTCTLHSNNTSIL